MFLDNKYLVISFKSSDFFRIKIVLESIKSNFSSETVLSCEKKCVSILNRCCTYCAIKIYLQCCTTQTSFRGETFHDFPRNLVKIIENRGNFGENIAPRIVVCVPSLQINSESTIRVSFSYIFR